MLVLSGRLEGSGADPATWAWSDATFARQDGNDDVFGFDVSFAPFPHPVLDCQASPPLFPQSISSGEIRILPASDAGSSATTARVARVKKREGGNRDLLPRMARMIAREPTIERLATAEALLLAPYGLAEAQLAAALATIGEHRVDDADLYFQSTRHEGWSLEEGIVKSGSFSIDQGVGVRAVSGEKTAFSYSDEISEAALLDAAAATRTIARAGAGKIKVAGAMTPTGGRSLYMPNDPLASLDATAKVKLPEHFAAFETLMQEIAKLRPVQTMKAALAILTRSGMLAKRQTPL